MKRQIKDLDVMTECGIKGKDYKVACHLTNVTVVINDKTEYTMIPNNTYVTIRN